MNTTAQHLPREHKKRKTWKIVLISIVALLILFRIFLPFIVLKFVNKKLASLEEYYGHVEDIDIAIIRGAYQIKDIRVQKIDKETRIRDTIPFFASPLIDLAVQWDAIFKGSIVGEITVDNPVVNFVKGKHEDGEVGSPGTELEFAL